MASNGAQTLLIDADDTLWENNIYFERAIARFISFLNHHEYSAEQVREILKVTQLESVFEIRDFQLTEEMITTDAIMVGTAARV